MNNHMGSRATADDAVMSVVLSYLQNRGKIFVDSRTTADTAGPRVARSLGMPILQRDVFIDNDTGEGAITDSFDKGVTEARDRGTAIAIGHVQNRGVVDILRAAERTLASQGVRMARLQDVFSARERKTGSEDSRNRKLLRRVLGGGRRGRPPYSQQYRPEPGRFPQALVRRRAGDRLTEARRMDPPVVQDCLKEAGTAESRSTPSP